MVNRPVVRNDVMSCDRYHSKTIKTCKTNWLEIENTKISTYSTTETKIE